MAVAGLRQDAITIINRVQRQLGVPETATLTTSIHSTMLLDFLNSVISEVSDAGRWQEAFTTANVTAISSVSRYSVDTQDIIQNIEEISFDGDASPLFIQDGVEIRRLNRVLGVGRPRQFAIQGVNSASNPVFEVYNTPGSNEAGKLFQVVYYVKPDILTSADSNTTPFFPAELLYRGVYARALLEENGGEPTREYLTNQLEYERQRNEALNRYNSDTGTTMQFTPRGRGI